MSWSNQENGRYDHNMINWVPGEHDQMPRVIHVNDVNVNNDAKIALKAVNSSNNADARALKVEGKTDLHGTILTRDQNDQFIDTAESGRRILIGTQELSGDVILGRDETVVQIHTETRVTGRLKIIDDSLESGGSEDQHLRIGVTDDTDNVILSRSGLITQVQGGLEVAEAAAVNGTLDVDGAATFNGQLSTESNAVVKGTLRVGPENNSGLIDSGGTENFPQAVIIGSQNTTMGVIIGHLGDTVEVRSDALYVDGRLIVGDGLNPGEVESNGVQEDPLDLRVASNANHSKDLYLSRAGRLTRVQGRMQVAESLCVGPVDAVGTINSGGPVESPQNLKIGNDTVTADVKISREGQNIDMFARTKFNSNECVLNNAPNLAAANGAGLVFNANGHGEGPSIDFYTGGVLRGWVDALGWNNV